MSAYLSVLRRCALFEGIEEKDLPDMLNCMSVKEKQYQKGEVILPEGETAEYFGIVLQGNVQIVRLDYFGNRSILSVLEAPQLFGESFACAATALPVSVIAATEVTVLLINAARITQTCCRACSFHERLIFNLLRVVARKNIAFHQKLEVTSRRSTRDKLLTYLLILAKEQQTRQITVSFNRQELADYLEVDRSGLSAEIGKLRREGVLECHKNRFTFLDDAEIGADDYS